MCYVKIQVFCINHVSISVFIYVASWHFKAFCVQCMCVCCVVSKDCLALDMFQCVCYSSARYGCLEMGTFQVATELLRMYVCTMNIDCSNFGCLPHGGKGINVNYVTCESPILACWPGVGDILLALACAKTPSHAQVMHEKQKLQLKRVNSLNSLNTTCITCSYMCTYVCMSRSVVGPFRHNTFRSILFQ